MLYSRTKTGKIQHWKADIVQRDGVTCVRRVWGQEGGKTQEAFTEIPKGKAKRSIMEQAQLVLNSYMNKKIDEGYSANIEDASTVVLPMLAHKWDESKSPKDVYIQPKLDGVRALLSNKGLITRLGKPIHSLPNIKPPHGLKDGEYIDGELYSHTIPFEKISGAVRRLEPCAEKIEFHAFDYFDVNNIEMGFHDRFQKLKSLWKTIVDTRKCSKTSIEAELDRFIQEGYEGVMIRSIDGKYAINERSNDLLKYKRFVDKEYRIVGAHEGTGRDKGTVVWVCETAPGGSQFNVRPADTLEQRRWYWTHYTEFLGKMLTVKFQEMTAAGVPRFPVGVAVRDYE